MRPLIAVLFAFILGLLFGAFSQAWPGSGPLFFCFVFSLVIAGFLVVYKRKYTRYLAFVPFFFLGSLFILPLVNPKLASDHIRRHVFASDGRLDAVIEGVVVVAPEARGARSRFILEAESISKREKTARGKTLYSEPIKTSGRVRLSVNGTPELFRGDKVRVKARVSLPKNFGNPGGFDYEWWLGRRGVYVTGYVRDGAYKKDNKPERLLISRGSGLFNFTDRLRARVSASIESAVSGGAGAGLLMALTTGKRGAIQSETRRAFSSTGIAHILAISGLHIGIVALLSFKFFLFCFSLSARAMLAINVKKASALLSFIPVLFYAMLAGFSLSTERAVIMVGAVLLAYLFDRGKDLLNTLALAALVILFTDPGALFEVSFQLSFAAVFAIVALMPRVSDLFKKKDSDAIAEPRAGVLFSLFEWSKGLALVTVVATIATAPIIIWYFNTVSFSALLLNLIVVPLVGLVVLPLSLIAVFILPLFSSLSELLFIIGDAVLAFVTVIVLRVSELSWTHTRVATPSLIFMACYYMLLTSLSVIKNKKAAALSVAIFIVALSIYSVFGNGRLATAKARGDIGEMEVTFLSVGQGDATFIRFPGGTTMLVDGGDIFNTGFGMGSAVIAPFLWKRGISEVDYMVLTHAQRDHMGGLNFIAENFKVKRFLWNGSGKLRELGDTLASKKIESEVISSTTKAKIIDGVRVEFLSPLSKEDGGLSGDLNEDSIVMRLTFNETSALLTGDIGFETEERLLAERPEMLRADILKSPHHGSRYSSSLEFLRGVGPDYIVASVGYLNRFGFPHPDTVARYLELSAELLRTDVSGAVTFRTDGTAVEVKSYLTDGFGGSILDIR